MGVCVTIAQNGCVRNGGVSVCKALAGNMLRWANRRSRPWLAACVKSFVSPFASTTSSRDAQVKLSASKVSRRSGDARRQHAHGHFSDATMSVRRQDVSGIRVLACRHQDSKGHSVDGDAKVFEPYANTHFNNGDARVTQSAACGQIQSYISDSPSSDVSNVSGQTLQTLVSQTQKEVVKMSPKKFELLESEQFSLSDAVKLAKRRAFKSCSFEQLSTVLQVLKECIPSAELVHDIVVGSSSILTQPAELVQQKLKLLYDFQVEEEVVSRLCGRGKVLSISVESLQKKLMFYKDMGLTVESRNMMFSKAPHILLYSIENNIQPALNLLESTGLTRKSIESLLRCRPEVLAMSHGNLIKRYEYFKQLGFSAKKFPSAWRAVGRLSIKSVKERMQSLKDQGFTDDDVLLMVKKQPAILCCSPEYTKRKLDFLICEQNRDMAEIVHDPSCLTLSLQGRMIPRFKFLKESGDSKVYVLSSILKVTDSQFMKRFGE